MNISDLYNKTVAEKGLVVGSNTESIAGSFYAIHCLTDCTFTTLNISNLTGSLTGIDIQAGSIIYGKITSVTASNNNSYILYKG
tara:strand:- start:1848 stop:2099 length:252 start_codon:yes stop_codon:yes gene_type:complete